jgi:hypothetical protein
VENDVDQPEYDRRHAKIPTTAQHLASDMPFDRMPSQHKRRDQATDGGAERKRPRPIGPTADFANNPAA